MSAACILIVAQLLHKLFLFKNVHYFADISLLIATNEGST